MHSYFYILVTLTLISMSQKEQGFKVHVSETLRYSIQGHMDKHVIILNSLIIFRVPSSSGNQGNPGKSPKKIHAWKNHGFCKNLNNHGICEII